MLFPTSPSLVLHQVSNGLARCPPRRQAFAILHGSQAGPVTCTTPQNSLTRLGLRSDLLVPCASAPQNPLAGVTVKNLPCTYWPNPDHFGAADAVVTRMRHSPHPPRMDPR